MSSQDPQISALQEELGEARAEVETLQSAAADAEACAATARAEISPLRADLTEARSQLDAAQAELASARAELASAQAELVEAHSQLGKAALKYREARLAAAPHIPADLVPGETMEEVDQQLEAAQHVVARLRQELAAEVRKEEPPARVPVGAPARRPPDLSALSPTEKIKLGLQQLAER